MKVLIDMFAGHILVRLLFHRRFDESPGNLRETSLVHLLPQFL